MLQKFLGDFGIDRRDFLVVCGLLFNVFTWLFFLRSLIDQIIISNSITDELVIWATFYVIDYRIQYNWRGFVEKS